LSIRLKWSRKNWSTLAYEIWQSCAEPRLKTKSKKISMSNPSNRSTGFMNFAMQSDAPGGGRAERTSAGAPDLCRPRGEDLRPVTRFGVTHYVQAAADFRTSLEILSSLMRAHGENPAWKSELDSVKKELGEWCERCVAFGSNSHSAPIKTARTIWLPI
jgi:hypothetical protein